MNPVSVFCRFAPITLKKSTTTPSSSNEAIHVAVDGESPNCTVTAADLRTCAWVQIGCKDVIDPAWTQKQVFDSVAAPLLEPLLTSTNNNGNNMNNKPPLHHAVVAFGETNAGKTHTIYGPHGASHLAQEDPEMLGLVPRALQFLFSSSISSAMMTIEVACVEIYNETARDLVALLRGGDYAQSSTYKATEKMRLLRSLQRARCDSLVASLELMKRLLELRRTNATASNDTSSRSHIVMRIILPQHRGNSITFCDLAGSECLRQTAPAVVQQFANGERSNNNISVNVSGSSNSMINATESNQRLETKNINASLLALKKVVRALRKQSDHIPFKDSMLTAVLEPCFHSAMTNNNRAGRGGENDDGDENISNSSNSKTCPMQLIVCCSGHQRDSAETLATLRFAAEASAIRPVGSLNPLTLSAINEQQQQQQLKKRSGAVRGNSNHKASTSRSSSAAAAAASASSSRSNSAVRLPPQSHNFSHFADHDDDRDDERQQDYINNINSAPESRSGSYANSNNNMGVNSQPQQQQHNDDSLKRVVTALVDENANLRMQLATQRQELEESSNKAAILMDKSVQLLERFEQLQRENDVLRRENAELKDGRFFFAGSVDEQQQSLQQQQPNQQHHHQQQQQAHQFSLCAVVTPPPAGTKLLPAMVASPSSGVARPLGDHALNHHHQQQQHQAMWGAAVTTTRFSL